MKEDGFNGVHDIVCFQIFYVWKQFPSTTNFKAWINQHPQTHQFSSPHSSYGLWMKSHSTFPFFPFNFFGGFFFPPPPPFFSLLLISSYYYPPFSTFSFHLLSFPSYISPIPLINTLLCSCTIVTHLFHTHVHLRLARHHLSPSPTTNTTTQGYSFACVMFLKKHLLKDFQAPQQWH